ncbi:hypothetical protein H5410_052622 [Solanum commersonii]|uniref:Uncharacterized protein n=1 Tax=Solanum commersonii TaxID=4109 RepID=A0A9J5X1L0_SOLCO|nr:hypothetical protein H5410_052622 [Solanum commersonii]
MENTGLEADETIEKKGDKDNEEDNQDQSVVALKNKLLREEEFWKLKAGMQWFKEGERNTKFFHTIVKGRRSRLRVNRIQNNEGKWLEDQEDIEEATIEFYRRQFTK